MVNDKDVNGVVSLMPKEGAFYIFTQASVERAMPAAELAAIGKAHGLTGIVRDNVPSAVKWALEMLNEDDAIFIGGSTFVVADALPLFMKEDK